MKRYSTATLVLLAIIFAGLTLCVSSRTIWADEEMITPQWVDDFAKGQTDAGKVPPEVKTQEKKKPIGGCTKTNKDGSQEWDVVYHHDKTGETTTIYYIKTKDKGGKPKTVWKIKVEKPGQPPRQPLTTRSPEIRPRLSKLTTRHRPARHTTPLRIIPLSTSATAPE